MSTTNDFGDLRSLLGRRPSAATFDLITQRLEEAARQEPTRTREEWLPYTESILAQWPDAERLCPKHRLGDYESGEPVWCALVRALDYEGVSMGKARVESVMAAPSANHVTHLDLRSANLKWDQIERIANEAPFRLRAFGFRRVSSMDWGALDTLFGSEMLSTVDTLTFRGWDKIKADVYDHLLENFPVEGLKSLDLGGGAVSGRKLKQLVATGRLDQLEVFRAGAWVSDKGSAGMLDVIVKHKATSNLRTLHLNQTRAAEFSALAGASHLGSLRELRLDGSIERESALAILSCPHLVGLESLRLTIADDARQDFLRALIASPASKTLTSLHLDWFDDAFAPTHEALEELLLSDTLSSLQRFAIPLDSPLAMDTLAAHADRLPELRELMILAIGGSDEGVRDSAGRLFSAAEFPALESLALNSYNKMGALLGALTGSPLLGQLKQLRPLEPTLEDLLGLLGKAELPCLQTLDLCGCPGWRMRGLVDAIAALETLPALESLILAEKHLVAKMSDLIATKAHALPEFLHVSCPEYAMFQQQDWM